MLVIIINDRDKIKTGSLNQSFSVCNNCSIIFVKILRLS